MFPRPIIRFLPSAASLLAVASLAGVSSVHAQANLTFSGGNGTPLVLTLADPVVYVANSAVESGDAPLFVFSAVGDLFQGGTLSVTSTTRFSINAGATQSISAGGSGILSGSITPSDAFFYGPVPGIAVGDVVNLTAGTLTSTDNFAGVPPAAGSFNTFLMRGDGSRISSNGVAVPEPSTWALLLGAGGASLAVAARRRGAGPARG